MTRIGALVFAIAVASCNYDWTYRTPDGGAPSDGEDGGDPNQGEDAGNGTCTLATGCPPGQFCRFADRACGLESTKTGQCLLANAKCSTSVFCTCDRSTAISACEAQSKGLDVNEDMPGSCKAPTFACGATECTSNTQVCVKKAAQGTCNACTEGCKCFPTCKCLDSNPEHAVVDCTP